MWLRGLAEGGLGLAVGWGFEVPRYFDRREKSHCHFISISPAAAS
jgi:hypothetical protein